MITSLQALFVNCVRWRRCSVFVVA